ncbi:hypothetical protein Hanom_Chr04g00303341 [Helianthus anomalus]
MMMMMIISDDLCSDSWFLFSFSVVRYVNLRVEEGDGGWRLKMKCGGGVFL